MSEIFMNQAIRNMKPMFEETNNLELIGLISAFLWIVAGMMADPILLIISLATSLLIFLYLTIESMLPLNDLYYNVHVASFRRMVAAGISLWRYTSGANLGPEIFTLFEFKIPVLLISQFSFVALIIIWFGTKYYDQITEDPISDIQIPFLVIRGLFRGILITGLLYALFLPGLIPNFIQFPYLFAIYLIEPIFYMLYQTTNRTYSTYELTLGNSRLPIVALRESLFSNLLILWGTMIFKGVEGQEWQLLRVLYIFSLVIIFIQSFGKIKEFKNNPLGNDPLGNFMKETPEILQNINLTEQIGHIIPHTTEIDLAKSSSILLEKGSIVVPLNEKKGNINTLILGPSTNVVEVDGERIKERVEGISSALIPKKSLEPILIDVIGLRLGEINFSSYNLPSVDKIEGMINQLADRLDRWILSVLDQITKIDLSNYGVTEEEGYTLVNLPGIMVNETPEMTAVKVANIRVYDANNSSTVRIGSWLNVVDMPNASFVSLPGLTVLDVGSIGSAVSILGFKVSDGIPAETLDKFKAYMLDKLNSWEMGIDVELGRILADKKANGVFSLTMDGQFRPLLDGTNKTLGDHVAMLKTQDKKDIKYLPSNFNEKPSENVEFIELTGLDLYTKSSENLLKKHDQKRIKNTKLGKQVDIKTKRNDIDAEINDVKSELKKKKENEDSQKNEFESIYDVEIIDEDKD